jgi:hypothetical protein
MDSQRGEPLGETRGTVALVVVLAAGTSALAYRGVLESYFWSDDFVLLYMLRDMSLPEFLLTPFGGHTVVARNVLFALTHAWAGLDPRPYFVTVVATHALNVALLGRLVWRLTGSIVVTGFGALAWGICPTAGASLSWYAAHSQVAATTCLLLAFERVARRAGHDARLSPRDLVVSCLWLCLSLLFFGTVIAVALVWPIVVLLLFPHTVSDRRRLGAIVGAAVAVFVVYEALQRAARMLYATPYTPGPLLDLVVEHPRPAVIAFLQLIRVGVTSLVLGAWWTPAPQSDFVSWLTLLLAAVTWVVALAAAGVDARRKLAAFTLVALAIYALTAVARAPAARELAGWTAARLAATLRYHYAAQAFLVAALCVAADTARAGIRDAVAIAGATGLLLGTIYRGVQVDQHDATRSAVAAALSEMRAQIEATPRGQTAYIPDRAVFGFGWMPGTMTPLPGLSSLFAIISPSDEVDGRAVRFTEATPAVAAAIRQHGGRLARLVVPPATVGDPPS